MSYISIKNYSQLSKLEESDIVKMMTQGINFLDGSIITFVSQLKNVEQEIMHNKESLSKIIESFTSDTFTIKSEDGIVEVNSDSVPPSLFFSVNTWEEKLFGMDGYSDSSLVLVPHRSKGALFISDSKSILRLSDSFEGIYDILSIEDIKNINL
jgi:hypothetical protein